jgi:hypothetical protein
MKGGEVARHFTPAAKEFSFTVTAYAKYLGV